MREIFKAGVEKVVLNTALFDATALISEAARIYGSQAITASIDVRRGGILGRDRVDTQGGSRKEKENLVTVVKRTVAAGAGEILITAIDRDDTLEG